MINFRSIHGRLFLIFLFSMLGLLLIVSFVYYQRATEQIRDKVGTIAEKNISQTVGLFDLLIKGYDSITKSLNSNVELTRLIQRQTAPAAVDAPDLDRRITDLLGAIFYSRNDIVGIHIFTNQGAVYSFNRGIMAGMTQPYADEAWFAQLKESTGEMKWLGMFPRSLMTGSIERPVLAFGRQLIEFTGLRPIGYVLIETEADAIESALANASLGPGSSVVIRGPDGGEIFRMNPMPAAEAGDLAVIPADWPAALRSGEVASREREDDTISAARIPLADWTVYVVTPKRDLKLELKETQQFLLTVIIVLVIAATALATLVSRSFSSPFKRLIQQMKQVELGNFKGRVQVQSYQELNVLVSSFNRMVSRMDELIQRIKLASISEKNAQLQALQSQVNPHFLFNTLDMIYWMLDERGNDKLGRVVLALSQIFRYSSDWEEASRATLRHELEQLRHYFTIIATRLGGRVHPSIEVEERWLDTQVPKMILQPIVENAVKYGLEPLNRPGALRVHSREEGGMLALIVEDNGVGMEEALLQSIACALEAESADSPQPSEPREAERLPDGTPGRRGVGLLNVHRRIRLMYGGAYGLRIAGRPDKGTTVTATFPIIDRGGSSS